MRKRLLAMGLIATMLIAGTVMMTGCSCSNKNASNTTSNQSTTTNQSTASNQTANQPAQQQTAAPNIVGNYKLIEKTDDGVTLNEGQITAQNKGRTLEIKADGTATKKEADGDVDTYRYDAEKFIESDGDVKVYTFDPNSNTLRITEGNDVYVYQKL